MNKEISAKEAAKLLNDDSTVLLDVREDDELMICQIEGALHIPMRDIPNCVEDLPRNKQLIIFCHHGMRSLNVCQFLEARGFTNTLNMTGGMHAWSIEVDSNMRRY